MTVVTTQSQVDEAVANFVLRTRRPQCRTPLTAVSLFSGGGLSDAGYLAAGFNIVVQAELESKRAKIGAKNFPRSNWVVGDIRHTANDIVKNYQWATKKRLSLLVATPPCQGLSSSNPSRGKRKTPDARKHARENALLLQIIHVAKKLKPRVIIAENVRQILTHTVYWNCTRQTIVDVLRRELQAYQFWYMPIDVADYGVPQSRTRAVIVGICKGEKCVKDLVMKELAPIPVPTHSEQWGDGYKRWVTIRGWFNRMKYEPLDARSEQNACSDDPLHCVPWYDAERYRLIADIPAHSGQSAYDNCKCPNCRRVVLETDKGVCSHCRGTLWNRPIVRGRGRPRLIKGFASSYRRMRSDRPSAVIATNSSHVGSDWKIHPYENRVLSAKECADLQTVPRWYKWDVAINEDRKYLIRVLIGEALPPYFTYLHGRVIAILLNTGKAQTRQLIAALD